MLNRKIKINNPSGLHMRPAGVFVHTSEPFKSSVDFDYLGCNYNGKSMIGVLSAAVKCGGEIHISVEGADEVVCMDALVAAIESGLGERRK